ncbi:LacI family DNA-binding transcriptional regulator [Catellatospora bangladeshensis]|uniref:LacI family DNA-binding transcriptional regulator n=1 Tax=Catellatospora bangladeshensis TaxID=310355 RepID=UPI0036236EC2
MTRPATRKGSVRDIAAATGLSIATVSRALNAHPSVAADTRDLVQRTAQRLRAAVRAEPDGRPRPARSSTCAARTSSPTTSG